MEAIVTCSQILQRSIVREKLKSSQPDVYIDVDVENSVYQRVIDNVQQVGVCVSAHNGVGGLFVEVILAAAAFSKPSVTPFTLFAITARVVPQRARARGVS